MLCLNNVLCNLVIRTRQLRCGKKRRLRNRMAFSSVSSLREYKHTHLSKVRVNGLVSNIYNGLVKDRISYALHNLREKMIM